MVGNFYYFRREIKKIVHAGIFFLMVYSLIGFL